MDALLLVKASLLLSATLVAERLLRRSPAVTRHRLWSALFAAVLALPVLGAVLPAWHVPVPIRWSAAAAQAVAAAPLTRHRQQSADAAAIAVDMTAVVGRAPAVRMNDGVAMAVEPGRARATALLLAIWGIGAAMAMTALVLSLLRTRRLARTADAVNDPTWRSAAGTLAARLGLRQAVRLLVTAGVDTPMAGGVWRPAIFLPAASRTWSAERRDVVLAHELAHLAARDPLRHLVARLALALYWFHPLAWIAARQETVAREQACDEAVLALGTRPSVYARVLLDLADSIARPAPALATLPMVQRSLLENRLMAILNDDARPVSRRLLLVAASALALLTLTVAAAQPAAATMFPEV
ncbi:MAG: M56 family metallopeptidase, partial [Acidobacteriota bacterium]